MNDGAQVRYSAFTRGITYQMRSSRPILVRVMSPGSKRERPKIFTKLLLILAYKVRVQNLVAALL